MRALGGLLVLLAATVPVSAQRAVEPGGVATTLVTLTPPVDAAPDSVHYTVEMADGFRLFARPTGAAPVADSLRLPLTFGVAPSAPAGRVEAGRVLARWSDGSASEHPFGVQVLARHDLRFRVGTDAATVTPGGSVELGYRLGNRGNAIDTVEIDLRAPDGWTRVALPPPVVLAPGDTAVGTLRLKVDPSAAPGQEQIVGISARGRDGIEARSARVIVVGGTNWFGGLASLPSTVFVGSSTGTEGLGGVAVRALGEVRPGARLSLDFRHSDQPFAAPAFRRSLTGPRFRLALETDRWRAAAGDVYTHSDLFTGPSVHGTGVNARWTESGRADAGRGASLLVATPANGLGGEEGHVVRASGQLPTRAGQLTATVSDLRRDAGIIEGYGVRSAGLRLETELPGSHLTVQAGVMHVASDSSGSRTGPALEASYRYQGDRGSVTARLRTVPATVPRTSAYGDELMVSGAAGIAPGLSALGWGVLTSSPLLGRNEPARTGGLTAGLRLALPRTGVQLQLTGELYESERPDIGTSLRRTGARGSVTAPAGPVVLELNAEYGSTRNTIDTLRTVGPYGSVRAGLRWYGDRDWLWLGLAHRDYGIGAAATSADLAGAVRLGPAELQGGLNTRLDAALAEGVTLWTGTTVDINARLAATLGVDYSPAAVGDRWRFSLGVQRRFALPLPVTREPAAHGVVYEDRNGNRARDEGEPTFPGLTVRLGPLATTTGPDGTFRFMDSVQGDLRLNASRLPLGLMVPADVYLPAAGYVEIPVVRTAAIELTLFLDRDGDQEWDPAEEPADGVVVSLVAPDGRTRDVAADRDGRARISAVSPGSYTLRIHPPATERTGGRPIERALTIEPGATFRDTIAVPLRQREIRMGPGG